MKDPSFSRRPGRPTEPGGTGQGSSPGPAPPAEHSPQARQLAAGILEVLAGLRTPADAARQLGISLARYYQLEVRALDGLVGACESRRGRGRRSGSELTQLRQECERLRRECVRQQALVRATRRAVGLAEPGNPPAPEPQERSRRRRRRPKARALKVVAELRAEAGTPTPEATPAAGSPAPEAQAPGAGEGGR